MLYQITTPKYKFIIGCKAHALDILIDLEGMFDEVFYQEVEADTRTQSEKDSACRFLEWLYA